MQTNVAQLLKAPVGSIRTLPIDDVLKKTAPNITCGAK